MIIDQLPEISSVQTTDEMPVERGQTTYKTPISKIFASPTLTGTPKAPTAGVSTDNTQIATTAFANRAANNAVSTFVRPNLLDNWYFVGGGSQLGYGTFPVNHRGQPSYSTNNAYTIDRWKLRADNGGTLTVSSDGITVSNGNSTLAIVQTFPNGGKELLGKRVTFSALITEIGTAPVRLVVGNATTTLNVGTNLKDVTVSAVGVTSLTVDIPATLSNPYLNFILTTGGSTGGGSFTVAAMKLEPGSTSTLAHEENGVLVLNEIPDYETELLRCKTSTADPSDPYANGSVEFGNNIGIVQNTNTATQNITKGQYVIWKGALYTASSAIASGATLSGSNLTAVTGGGLNALKDWLGWFLPAKSIALDSIHNSFSIPSACRLFGVILDSDPSYCGLYYFNATGAGVPITGKFSNTGLTPDGTQNNTISFAIPSPKTLVVMLYALDYGTLANANVI